MNINNIDEESENSHLDIVKFLISKGANIEGYRSIDGYVNDYPELEKLLLWFKYVYHK